MSGASKNPTVLYINYEKAASGAIVHRDAFVSAARALGANLVQHPEPRSTPQPGREPGLRQRFKRWLYQRWTELALFLMTFKESPGEARVLWQAKPDVVLVNYAIHISSIFLGRTRGVPVVLQIHCPYYLHAQYSNERLRFLSFWKWLERRAINLASSVVVVSNTLRDYYVGLGFPQDRFSVVPNGVDLSQFDPTIRADAVRDRFGLHGSLVIGFVGVLVSWIGIDWFLEVLVHLGSVLNNVKLLIVGQGELEPRLRQIAANPVLKGRVHFAGFVPHAEVPEYLASFDIAVAPYRKVDLFYFSPMKLYEYLAMGKPVIAPRMGQNVELIQHGENGLLYEPDDAEEMLAHLRLLIQDAELRLRLGRAALKRSHEMAWTWERNAAAILDVCRAVAGFRMDRTISLPGSH